MQYEALTAELERALVRQLALRYAEVNEDRFRNRLRSPVLALTDATGHLGRWVPATRTIELSRAFTASRPWLEITSVLEHEMAHQFVDEVLGVREETSHGDSFRRVCAERGIDARAAGAPLASTDAGDTDASRTLDRIRKLLALAASSNQHEAEIAMRRAHELMLRHNIEHVAYEPGYEVRHLGDPLRRGNRVETEIMLLLGEFFFVKVIRVPVYVPHRGQGAATSTRSRAPDPTSRWPSTCTTSCTTPPTACGARTAPTRACAMAAIASRTRPASCAAFATSSAPSARSYAAPASCGSATATSSTSIARAIRGSPRAARTSRSAARTPPVARPVAASCCTSR